MRQNKAMHAKAGLRVVLKWKIFRPDSVIFNVIGLILENRHLELQRCTQEKVPRI